MCTVNAADLVGLQPYVRTVGLSSWTRPQTLVSVSAETSGKCRTVLVDVGDRVPENGIVVELDDTFVRLDLAKNRISQEQAQRQLDEEKKNLRRYTELINKKSTPQATYDQAALQADLYNYSRELLKIEEQSLTELLARHTVSTQPGWIVTRRLIEPGEYVRQGEPLLEVGDFRTLLATFLLTVQELDSLRKMAAIELEFPALNRTVAAQLHQISPLYDGASKKIEVELRLDAGGHPGMRAGLQTQLTVEGEEVPGQFVVPASALINRYEAHWLQAADGGRHKVILLGYASKGLAIIAGADLAMGQNYVRKPTTAAAVTD